MFIIEFLGSRDLFHDRTCNTLPDYVSHRKTVFLCWYPCKQKGKRNGVTLENSIHWPEVLVVRHFIYGCGLQLMVHCIVIVFCYFSVRKEVSRSRNLGDGDASSSLSGANTDTNLEQVMSYWAMRSQCQRSLPTIWNIVNVSSVENGKPCFGCCFW